MENLLKKDYNAIILAVQSKMSADNAEVLGEKRKLKSIIKYDLVLRKKLNYPVG